MEKEKKQKIKSLVIKVGIGALLVADLIVIVKQHNKISSLTKTTGRLTDRIKELSGENKTLYHQLRQKNLELNEANYHIGKLFGKAQKRSL